jgi:hypothetical protein
MKDEQEQERWGNEFDFNRAFTTAFTIVVVAGFSLGGIIHYIRNKTVEGVVVSEYGDPKDGSYGFQLKSDSGRNYFVHISSWNEQRVSPSDLEKEIEVGTKVRTDIWEKKSKPAHEEFYTETISADSVHILNSSNDLMNKEK